MLKIGDRVLGYNQPVFVIAEIGINHNGFLSIAKELIDEAVTAGCDAVKFQKRTVPIVYTPTDNYDPGSLDKPRTVNVEVLRNAVKRGVLSPEAIQRLQSSNFDNSTNGDLKWALEFTYEEYEEIDAYCESKGILWFASPWDEDSVDFLAQFDLPCWKIASPSLTDDGLLKHIRTRSGGKPLILSTGMSDLKMVRHAVDVVGRDNLVLLHCTSVYPQGLNVGEQILRMINLRAMETLAKEFPGVPVGFSSHDSGIVPTFAAVVMGACVVEKHFTRERGTWGSDQASSIEPDQMTDLCRWTREFHVAKGDGGIVIYPEEREVMKKLRRK